MRITISAHQTSAPKVASQQPVMTKQLHRYQTIAELHQSVN